MSVTKLGGGGVSALAQWPLMFPDEPPEKFYRRFAQAAGDEHTVRVLVEPSLSFPKHGPIELVDTHIRLFHNVPFKSTENYIEFRINGKKAHIEEAKFDEENMGQSLARRYVREIGALAQERGCEKITLQAQRSVGGYAWAKFGFKPDSREQWRKLAKVIDNRLHENDGVYTVEYIGKRVISELDYRAIKDVLAEKEPEAIWKLLELQTPLGKAGGRPLTLAKALLLGTKWDGVLSTDARSEGWQRFSEYTQPLKEQHVAIGA